MGLSTLVLRKPTATALALLALIGACGRTSPPSPNIVIAVVDAMRADRLSAYGAKRPTTPNLEAIAAGGALFTDAWSPAPWTVPSVASLLTGLHPLSHGAGMLPNIPANLGDATPTTLAPSVKTLADRLGKLGYECEAFSANVYADGLLASFRERAVASACASDVADFAIGKLGKESAAPMLLYLHFMDCHEPILAPNEDLLAVLAPDEPRRIPELWARTLDTKYWPQTLDIPQISPREWHRHERLHAIDGAIHYVDRQLGKIAEAAKRAKNGRPTILVVTADHGEEVFDHADLPRFDPRGVVGLGHGHTLFAELLHVPLVIVGPGIAPRRVESQVSLLDVAPTLLDLVGANVTGDRFDGRSLLELLKGGSLEARGSLGGSIAYGVPKLSWTTEKWRLIVAIGGEEPPMLFDRVADPQEHKNLAAVRPDAVAALRKEMKVAIGAIAKRQGRQMERLDDGMPERLRAVGYLNR